MKKIIIPIILLIAVVASLGISAAIKNKPVSAEYAAEEYTDEDKYGIKVECEKYGIYPEVPHYLPEGFELYKVEHHSFENNNNIEFQFRCGDDKINIGYDMFTDKSEMSEVGFPSDHFNLEKIEINDREAITSKEDGQFTLVYPCDNILMSIYTKTLSYDECDKIAQSIR